MRFMYDHKKIEAKWQKKWAKAKTFSPDLDKAKKPFYNLMMFPYPSAAGLHVGHTYAFGGADAYGRFKRLEGYSVFEPMGFDAFGIHSENYAIKVKSHPRELIAKTTAYFRENQMKRYGGMWDWTRQIDTTDPKYYKWTQWLFTKLFKNGLVERKEAALNWCPSCKTVLSDEQVEKKLKSQNANLKTETNICERCKNEVERKETEQWFFKITDYAERLLDYHDTKWPETTVQMQTNWIGRSHGAEAIFKIKETGEEIPIFTTRPDTLFGCTFFVLAPEHPLVALLLESDLRPELRPRGIRKIRTYLEKVKNRTAVQREEGKQKTGVFTGLHATNPVNNQLVPVWIADYVMMEYGTGAIMSVPAHDQRDWEFAKKYKLPVIPVIKGEKKWNYQKGAWDEAGELINSGPWNGWQIPEQMDKVTAWLEKKQVGRADVRFRLRDWCISRQRYWGPPIPMIYCRDCAQKGASWFTSQAAEKVVRDSALMDDEKRVKLAGEMRGWYPERDQNLPVKLPYIKDYQPKGEGQSPLSKVAGFYQVKCPYCGGQARRETDVSDTFLDSAWYFLRYPSTEFADRPMDAGRNEKWLPVDMYIGGNEHACLHLLYTRFVTMALYDLGYLHFQEPFKRFFAHGLIIKDGAKMSKSRGNIINPDGYIDKHGADALRMYLLFLGPFDQGGDFRDTGIRGMDRFLTRLYQLARDSAKSKAEMSPILCKKLHQTIRKMSNDFSKLRFNTAIAALMELANTWQQEKETANKELIGIVARLIAPIAPHLAEEFWSFAGGEFSVLDAGWPKFDSELAKEEEAMVVVQVNGKLREKLLMSPQEAEDEGKIVKLAKASARVQKYLQDKKIKKTIFVSGKLLNLVVS